jgi:hypothetical protein
MHSRLFQGERELFWWSARFCGFRPGACTELPTARTPQPRKILRSLKLRSCFQCSIYKLTGMRCYSKVVDFTLRSRCHLRPDGCALRFHRTALAGWGRDKSGGLSGIFPTAVLVAAVKISTTSSGIPPQKRALRFYAMVICRRSC